MSKHPESESEESHAVTLVRRGVAFEAEATRTLLEAALAAGIELPFSCAVGGCMACKTRLISGNVTMPGAHGLSATARDRGWILLCRAHALGPIVLDA